MDPNEIDVNDATVRSESPTGSNGTSIEPESAMSQSNPIEAVPESAEQVHAQIERADTVLTSQVSASLPSHPADNGTPAEVARVLLGHKLDHFALETMIGGGGMGAVFRARDTRLDRTVAIKVIPRVGEDPELQRRFRNEAQSAARLDHPNIARVYDVGQHGGWHYIVFEYIEGINLRDLVIRDGVLSVDDAVYYTRQIAEALEHAHRRGVVHRDIKPSNVLITTTGQAKLVDMGLARAQQLDVSDDMTASGVTLGTFDYISPEQARDPRDADVRSDIYSLGCTLYFALTGRPPYPSGTVLQKLLSHGSSPAPDPRKVRKDLSSSLVAVLHKMLAKQPADRYRRPLDLISDLYQLAERDQLPRALSAGSISIAPANRFARSVEYHLPWVVAFILLFVSAGWLQILSTIGSDLTLTSVPIQLDSGSEITLLPSDQRARPERRQEVAPLGQSVNPGTNTPATVVPTRPNANNDPASGSGPSSDSGTSDTSIKDAPTPVVPATGPAEDRTGATENSSNLSTTDALGRIRPDAMKTDVIRVVARGSSVNEGLATSGVRTVGSLFSAIEAVEADASLTTIEIEGEIVVERGVRFNRKGLKLRGLDSSSTLKFTGPVEESPTTVPFIDLSNYGLEIENLRFEFKSSNALTNKIALFGLRGGNTVRMSKCTITVETVNSDGKCYAFRYLPMSTSTSGEGQTEASRASLVALDLKDCIIRGSMTMVGMERAGQLEFRWDNGLLCVDGSMIELGNGVSSLSGGERTRLMLTDVTAVVGDSLVSVVANSDADQIGLIDRDSTSCVYSVVGNGALLRIEGLGDEVATERFVVFRGRENYYDTVESGTRTILSIPNLSGPDANVQITDVLGMNPPKWFQETAPQTIVNWSESIPGIGDFSRATPSNFLQEGVLLPGFRLADLPLMVE